MAITERMEISQRTVLVDGQIQVQESHIIEDDGVELSRKYHRYVVVPGQDVDKMPDSVQRIAKAEHTAEVVAAYRARTTPAALDAIEAAADRP